jgi:hypothetical protein
MKKYIVLILILGPIISRAITLAYEPHLHLTTIFDPKVLQAEIGSSFLKKINPNFSWEYKAGINFSNYDPSFYNNFNLSFGSRFYLNSHNQKTQLYANLLVSWMYRYWADIEQYFNRFTKPYDLSGFGLHSAGIYVNYYNKFNVGIIAQAPGGVGVSFSYRMKNDIKIGSKKEI